MKFSKELDAQLIPEWKDAFVNYSHLKKKVKKMKVRRGSHSEELPDFGVSLFDSFRFISRKISSAFRDQKAEKREIIKVDRTSYVTRRYMLSIMLIHDVLHLIYI